jgi:hypothetical protein
LPTEVQALLDFKGGLEKYHRDDKWREGVIDHFISNLERMVSLAQGAGIPILLVNPGCNLRDTPPFKSEQGDPLPEEKLLEWNSLRNRADDLFSSDPQGSLELLRKAVEIDNHHAGTI